MQPKTAGLLEFVTEVFSYEYSHEPNYPKLRFLLTKALDMVIDKKYDWYPLLNRNWNGLLDISQESIDKNLLQDIVFEENAGVEEFKI